MQQQTSALQRLNRILNDFMLNTPLEYRDDTAIPILVAYINSSDIFSPLGNSSHLIDFFALLSTAREEIGRMKDRESSRRVIEKLNDYFINNIDVTWEDFAKFIEDGNIIDLLDSLADHYHTQNPAIFLESDFLDGLKDEFNSLLDEIINSDLSNNLKKFLIKQIEDILYAIRRYPIDGSDGLQKATQSFVSNLVTIESHLDKKDKKNSIFRKSVSEIIVLLHFFRPNSIYDFLGVVPAIDDYYRPRIERFIKDRQEIEASIDETSTMIEIIERSLQLSNKQPQKSLPGKEQKSLPSAKAKKEPPLKMEANLED
jgi:hypothetical protein